MNNRKKPNKRYVCPYCRGKHAEGSKILKKHQRYYSEFLKQKQAEIQCRAFGKHVTKAQAQ